MFSPSCLSRIPQKCRNVAAPSTRIIILRNQRIPIVIHQINTTSRLQAIVINCAARFDVHRIRLARIPTGLSIIIKEGPESRAVDENIGRARDSLEPRHSALCIASVAVGKIGITARCCPWCGGQTWRAGALPVWSFGLLHSDVDILCVVEIILVKRVVFESCADKPGSSSGFNENTSAGWDGLGVVPVKIMVCCPAYIFDHVSCIGWEFRDGIAYPTYLQYKQRRWMSGGWADKRLCIELVFHHPHFLHNWSQPSSPLHHQRGNGCSRTQQRLVKNRQCWLQQGWRLEFLTKKPRD